MNKKKALIIVVALALAVAILLGLYFFIMPRATAGVKDFTVTVVHGDGATKNFSYKTDAEYVGQVLLEEGLIAGEDGPYGLYIQSVDGEKAVYEEDGAYWAFYVGEAYANQGIDLTPIEDGAAYKLVYTTE